MTEERRKEDALLSQFIHENRKERDSFRQELKDLAEYTDRRIENLAHETSAKIDRLSDETREGFRNLSAHQRRDPKLWLQFIAALAPFIIAGAALIAFSQSAAVNPLKAKLDIVSESSTLHYGKPGHVGALEKHKEHSGRIDHLFADIEDLQNWVTLQTADRWSKKDHERWEEFQLNKRLERMENICFRHKGMK